MLGLQYLAAIKSTHAWDADFVYVIWQTELHSVYSGLYSFDSDLPVTYHTFAQLSFLCVI